MKLEFLLKDGEEREFLQLMDLGGFGDWWDWDILSESNFKTFIEITSDDFL